MLAQQDTTRTLPTMHDWLTMYSHAEKQLEVLSKRPRFKFHEIRDRRLFRLADLERPLCPSATVLAIGPEAVMPGDEVSQVVGSVIPVVPRRTSSHEHDGMPEALVVGEAFLTGFNRILGSMHDQSFERWRLVDSFRVLGARLSPVLSRGVPAVLMMYQKVLT